MSPSGNLSNSKLYVLIQKGKCLKKKFAFTKAFHIGRNSTCDVRLMDQVVSRFHATVFFKDHAWWIKDLGSANGIYVDGLKIKEKKITKRTQIRLGTVGPIVAFSINNGNKTTEKKDPTETLFSLTHYQHHYFANKDEETAGHHTLSVRKAYAEIRKNEFNQYLKIISGIVFLLILTTSYAVYNHFQIKEQKKVAEEIFYSMKMMEIELGRVLKTVRRTSDKEAIAQVQNSLSQQKNLERNYNQFIDSLKVYGKGISEEKRVIMSVARSFGECELNIPDGFYNEVLRYIDIWKSTKRLEKAINRAKDRGYIVKIKETLEKNDLPLHFFYLALQESNFDIDAVGPKTRFGIAKGLWQFIPATAEKYGLRIGPLVEKAIPDPKDDRHHFGRSTLAAVRYLKDIYATDAQASGLLVMASYNWGQTRVLELIRKLPKNPKDRNFWALLLKYRQRIPKQTYDYVFYVFSAAVIGEQPELFGFNFENPLSSTSTTVSLNTN